MFSSNTLIRAFVSAIQSRRPRAALGGISRPVSCVRSASASIVEHLEHRAMFSVTADPGPDPSTALYLGDLNGSALESDTIGGSDGRDAYKFTMARAGRFSGGMLLSDGTSAKITLFREGFDSNGRVQLTKIESKTISEASFAEFSDRSLAGGNYYVFVEATGTGTSDYVLGLTSDFAGGSLGAARDLGHAADTTVHDMVGANDFPFLTDPTDIYKFKMDARGTANVSVFADHDPDAEFSGHFDVIRDVNGNGVVDAGDVLASAHVEKSAAQSLTLDAGTYFIRMTSDQDFFSNYHVHLNADYAGNTPTNRRVMGSLDAGKHFTDFVGVTTDPVDEYSFHVDATRPLNLVFNQSDGATSELILYKDRNNNGVADPNEAVLSTDDVSFVNALTTVDAGNYIVQLNAASGEGTYELFAEARPDQAGNSLGSARNLGTINGLRHVDDFVSDADTTDYYKFTASAAGRISAQVTSQPDANVDLALIRDANNNGKVDANEILTASTLPGDQIDQISKSIAARNYFLRVTDNDVQDSTSKYFLSFHTDYAGDMPSKARSIGTLSGTQSFDDWASGPFGGVISDQTDLYKFSVKSTKTLTAKLKGETSGQDLDLQLYRDKNNDGVLTANELIASSSKPDSASEQISKSLSASTYYVRVAGVNGETNYHLSLNA